MWQGWTEDRLLNSFLPSTFSSSLSLSLSSGHFYPTGIHAKISLLISFEPGRVEESRAGEAWECVRDYQSTVSSEENTENNSSTSLRSEWPKSLSQDRTTLMNTGNGCHAILEVSLSSPYPCQLISLHISRMIHYHWTILRWQLVQPGDMIQTHYYDWGTVRTRWGCSFYWPITGLL